MDLAIQEVRQQEESSADLRISDLLRWQEVLDVPLADLLVDTEGPLSDPISRRAGMVRVMKTAKAIQEAAQDRSVLRLVTMLIEQLVIMMPELEDVSAWHSVGQRRTQDELGKIVEKTIPENFFNESAH